MGLLLWDHCVIRDPVTDFKKGRVACAPDTKLSHHLLLQNCCCCSQSVLCTECLLLYTPCCTPHVVHPMLYTPCCTPHAVAHNRVGVHPTECLLLLTKEDALPASAYCCAQSVHPHAHICDRPLGVHPMQGPYVAHEPPVEMFRLACFRTI
eukprot:1160235-Pelagomonas_calceolata.AAC.5